MTTPAPRTARADDKPCSLYAHSCAPIPARTQGHHRHPVYLQNRVYGQIRDSELMYVCGTCHDNIHEVIGWLLGESREPSPMPGWKTHREAERTVDWYRAALAEKESTA